MVSQDKKSQVDQLVANLNSNPHFFIIGFEKTKHQSLEGLRKDLKKSQSKLLIIKNTLFSKALNKFATSNKAIRELISNIANLKNQSAIVSLSADWATGLKAFYNYAKKETTVNFKAGFLDNQYYDQVLLERIAKLPGKDELVAKVIGSMKSPMSQLVCALKFNTNKFVYILKQKSTN